MWRGGRKCGRASKLTRDDDAGHGSLNPVVGTDVSEIFGLQILSRLILQVRFGDRFRGLLVEPLVDVLTVFVRSRPFVCV